MNSNRVTLAQLSELATAEVASLPVDQLAMLQEDVAKLKEDAKLADNLLTAALMIRFGTDAQKQRNVDGKDTGTVRLTAGDHVVVCDAPKKVDWSQSLLAKAVDSLRALGEDISEYVTVKYDVPERNYTAWPQSLKALFTDARTVGVGRLTFRIEARKREAA